MSILKATLVLASTALAACTLGLLSQRRAVDEYEALRFGAVDGSLTKHFETESGAWRATDGAPGSFEHVLGRSTSGASFLWLKHSRADERFTIALFFRLPDAKSGDACGLTLAVDGAAEPIVAQYQPLEGVLVIRSPSGEQRLSIPTKQKGKPELGYALEIERDRAALVFSMARVCGPNCGTLLNCLQPSDLPRVELSNPHASLRAGVWSRAETACAFEQLVENVPHSTHALGTAWGRKLCAWLGV